MLREAFERSDELAPYREEIRPAVVSAIQQSQAWRARESSLDSVLERIMVAVLGCTLVAMLPILWFHFEPAHGDPWLLAARIFLASVVASIVFLVSFAPVFTAVPGGAIVGRLIVGVVASTVFTWIWLSAWPSAWLWIFNDPFSKGFVLSLAAFYGIMSLLMAADSLADVAGEWVRARYHREAEVIGLLCLMLGHLEQLADRSELTLVSTIGLLTRNFRRSITAATALRGDVLDFEFEAWRDEKIRRRVTYLRRLKRDAMVARFDEDAAATLLLATCRLLPLAARSDWMGFPEATDDVDEVGRWEKWRPRIRAMLAFAVVCALWATVQFAQLPALEPVRPQAAFGLLTVIVLMVIYWIDPTHHDTIRSGLSTGMGLFKGTPKP